SELIEHLLDVHNTGCELFLGEFDNYVSEIMEPDSQLYQFKPDVVVVLPSGQRCRYQNGLNGDRELPRCEAIRFAQSHLELAATLHSRTKAEILLGNLVLPAAHDPGAYRSRTLGSDWNFRKWVNLELGLNAPACVQICDLEFLAYRRGGLSAEDP